MKVLDAAADGVGLKSVYQPIVSLPDEVVVGFEALSRWPPLGDPGPKEVFAHAAATGRERALDRMCIDAAIEGALNAELERGYALFINCEPRTPHIARNHDDVLTEGFEQFQVVFELTERSLSTDPRALLRKVAALRSDGFAIALDDVGAHADSLALLDVIAPDVIKLDLALVQSQPGRARARTLAAVLGHHERAGATILAEGIETAEHLRAGLYWGASLGQGYMFGFPGPIDDDRRSTIPSLPIRTQRPQFETGSPFDVVAESTPVRTERKETVMALSRYIESQATHATDPPLVLAAVQRAHNFTPGTRGRYRDLASTSPLVAVFGQGLPADLGSGMRGVDLDPSDPLCGLWIVLTLGPNNAAALIGREQDRNTNPRGLDGDRRYDLAITNDRDLVTSVARNLLARMN